MTTSNQRLLDAYLRAQTQTIRYSNGLSQRLSKLLLETEDATGAALLNAIIKAPGRDLTSKKARDWVSNFESRLRAARTPGWKRVLTEFREESQEFAALVSDRTALMLQATTPVLLNVTLPPVEQLRRIVNAQPFRGRTLKQWANNAAEADVQRILTLAKTGIVQGLTPVQIARSVMGTEQLKRRDGVTHKALRDLTAIVQTVTIGIQNDARQALYRENSDIIKKERYLATLDARTTLICASLDGKIFDIGEGAMPPMHFRCRSVRVPNLDPSLLSQRPANPTIQAQFLREFAAANRLNTAIRSRGDLPFGYKTRFDEFSRKRKKQLVGTVPGRTNYSDWLKQQSTSFQNEVLGVRRAQLFRNDEINLTKFVARDGDVFTLDELRAKGILDD